MLGRVEILTFFTELLDAELLERLVDFGGNGLEGLVHFAVFANAIDVIKCRQQRGQHIDNAVLVLTDEACPADSRADARAWAAENLVRFELTARQTLAALGIRAPVKACLVNMYFPTRRYDGGALPAGRYDAVRLDIGTRRAGRNWWCVLYPGLCRSACGGYDTPAENDLVCGEYIVRFRFVEWWGGLTAPREDVVLAG